MKRWQLSISTMKITSVTVLFTPRAGRMKIKRKGRTQPASIMSECFMTYALFFDS